MLCKTDSGSPIVPKTSSSFNRRTSPHIDRDWETEENKQDLVDIDTSGPGAEVELEEPKEKVEVVNETTEEETKPVEATSTEEKKEEKKETSDEKQETKKEELEDYSLVFKLSCSSLTPLAYSKAASLCLSASRHFLVSLAILFLTPSL